MAADKRLGGAGMEEIDNTFQAILDNFKYKCQYPFKGVVLAYLQGDGKGYCSLIRCDMAQICVSISPVTLDEFLDEIRDVCSSYGMDYESLIIKNPWREEDAKHMTVYEYVKFLTA